MNSTLSFSTSEKFLEVDPPETASGPWSIDVLGETQIARKSSQGIWRPIGFLVALAISPVTSVPDPWISEGRQHTQPTAYVLVKSFGRRRISRSEARELALRFMKRMEADRLQAAEDEARRSFPLEDFE